MSPDDPEHTVVPDESLAPLVLGYLRGVCAGPQFPLLVRGFAENYDPDGDVESFTIITRSGLRLLVSVHYQGRTDDEGPVLR